MWKFFSRGVRETLEKGFRIVRPSENTVKKDCTEHTTYCRKFTPCFLESINKYRCSEKEDAKKSKYRSTAHESEDTILGAVSYSSALALGWFLSQPCLWRKWCSRENKKDESGKINLVHLLGKVANTQPVNVGIHTDSNLSLNDSVSSDFVDGAHFGPKTAEEVINEAAEELRIVNDSVMALAENRRGVDFISAKRLREAVVLFRSASQRGYAPASYNLAQCYEMGIGTKQDFAEAAKWYRIAADKGHATAKYNLGVFYAHGWGGLKACSKTARKLLEEAAELGQPDAIAALGFNKANKDIPLLEDGQDWNLGKEPVDSTCEDPNKLYTKALSYEPYVCDDVSVSQVILQMHKMASDLGHAEARERYQLLEAYEAIGLLQEYLCGKKKAESNYFVNRISPAIVI